MATTTPNFGWPVPTSTDLVKDGATAIEALGDSIDASLLDLKGGTTGQVLAKASGTDMDFSWVAQDDSNAIQNAIVDAKGDLIAASAADTPARLAVGTNTAVLTADSTASTGLAWEGVWQDWTASITGITVGNGTVISRYRKVGKSVDVYFKFTMGSTSAISGLNYFALPFAQKTASEGGFISGGITDFGVKTFSPFSETNGNNIILGVVDSSGTYGSWTRISSTVPMTWATNDVYWAYMRYEAA
jgi:hypothetical protein